MTAVRAIWKRIAICFLIGVFGFWDALMIRELVRFHRTNWGEAQGNLLHAEVIGGSTRRLDVKYRYIVEGESYESSSVWSTAEKLYRSRGNEPYQAIARLKAYPDLSIRYNREKPEEAYVLTNHTEHYLIISVLTAFLLYFAVNLKSTLRSLKQIA